MLNQEGALFKSFKYQNTSYINTETQERIVMITVDSWFMRISERLHASCLQELASVKYVPQLNLKDTEETHLDYMKL